MGSDDDDSSSTAMKSTTTAPDDAQEGQGKKPHAISSTQSTVDKTKDNPHQTEGWPKDPSDMDAIAAETNEPNAGKNAAALEVEDIEEDEAAIDNKIPEEHDFFRYKYSCQKLNGRYQSAWEHKKFGTTTFDWWMERCDKED